MAKPKPPGKGGARKGAGRKRGSGKGRKTVSTSISWPPEDLAWIDRMRKGVARGKWIIQQLRKR